jgi:hypothetical protein
MATTKKPVAAVAEKVVPASSAKPAVKPAAAVAKPAAPAAVAAPAAKKVAVKAAAKVADKPLAKPVAQPPAVAKPAAKAVSKPAADKKAKTKGAAIEPAQRANYIEVAAFYIAERRGFTPGNPEQDYLEAAAEIDRLIAAGHFGI